MGAFYKASRSIKERLLTLPGAELHQEGEGTVLFDASYLEAVVSILRLRKRRRISEAERRRLAAMSREHRFSSGQRGLQNASAA